MIKLSWLLNVVGPGIEPGTNLISMKPTSIVLRRPPTFDANGTHNYWTQESN
jgi:hypothetical protein